MIHDEICTYEVCKLAKEREVPEHIGNDAYIVENGKDDELSEWRKKREMHSKMMGAAINAGDMESVKFHSTRIIQCDRMIAFLERY